MCSTAKEQTIASDPGPEVKITAIRPLQSFPLTYYLWNHRIPLHVAQHYCLEAIYTSGKNTYAAIAFPNNFGSYTLLNRHHEYSAGPQSPTLISNESPHLAVFNHFLDLLTLVTRLSPKTNLPDLLVLPDNLPTRSIHSHYQHIHLFLRNDPKGLQTAQIKTNANTPITDHRPLYQAYKSLNDWACHIGLRPPKIPTSPPLPPLVPPP